MREIGAKSAKSIEDAVRPEKPVSPGAPGVLITGATGYIGGRLVPILEAADVRLRCLARHPAVLAPRVSQTTEVVAGDLLDPRSLDRALAGIDVAYYLVHSMGAHGDYRETDRVAARNFGDAARKAGVRRIVYLGGLATGDAALSKHLQSRIETGEVLRASGVPVVEFRASVVIGSGSLSFELIRALVERLPIMIAGMAGLVAGALSMAAGEYVSVSSQADTEQADLRRERQELARQPELEEDELTQIYVSRGLELDLARMVAVQLTAKGALAAHARDELGLTDELAARPLGPRSLRQRRSPLALAFRSSPSSWRPPPCWYLRSQWYRWCA